MKLYHRSPEGSADRIMAVGFRDGTSTAGRRGVWLSSGAPLDSIWAYGCPAVIEVDTPDETAARWFFPVLPGTPRRSVLDWYLASAAEANEYPRRRVDGAWRFQETAFLAVVEWLRAAGLGGPHVDTIVALADHSRSRRGSPEGVEQAPKP